MTKIIGVVLLALAAFEFYRAFTLDEYSAQFYMIKGLLFVLCALVVMLLELMQLLKNRLDQCQNSPSSKNPSETP